MIRISRSIAMAVPAEQIWQTLRAFGDLALWHPAVETCHSGEGQPGRLGTARHVVTRDGLGMGEEIASVSDRDRRIEIITRSAPFPVSLMWQGLTVHDVTTTGGAVLRWELRADGPPEWANRISDWFGAGYIPAGLNGLAGYLAASNGKPIN